MGNKHGTNLFTPKRESMYTDKEGSLMLVNKVSIICDSCGKNLDTGAINESDAMKYGWHRDWTFNGGRNRCPECSRKRFDENRFDEISGCTKCANPLKIRHIHGECLEDDWASWTIEPPEGWEIDMKLTYILPNKNLCVRIKRLHP